MSDDATDVDKALAAFGAPAIRYHSFAHAQIRPSRIVLPRRVSHPAPQVQSPHIQSEPISAPEPAVMGPSPALSDATLTDWAAPVALHAPVKHESTPDPLLNIPDPPEMVAPRPVPEQKQPAPAIAMPAPAILPPRNEPEPIAAFAPDPVDRDAALHLARAPIVPGPDVAPPPDAPPRRLSPEVTAASVAVAVSAAAVPHLIAAAPEREAAPRALSEPISDAPETDRLQQPSHTLSELFAFLALTPALGAPPASSD